MQPEVASLLLTTTSLKAALGLAAVLALGACAGHQIEKRNVQTSDACRISIRMNDGSCQQVAQSSSADIRVGDRVLVSSGAAQRS